MKIERIDAALLTAGLLLAGFPLLLGAVTPWRDVPAVTDGQDPLLQCAILQQTLRVFPWTLERWHAPFSWPGAYSLAYMDPLAGQALLVAWVPGVRAFPALAYNLALVLTLWLAAAFTFVLARSLGGGRLAAALAATGYVASPYALGHLQHLNQLPTPWLPLALWGIVRLAQGGQLGAVILGFALVMQILSGAYYTVALALVVACVLIAAAARLSRRSALAAAAALAVFSGALWLWSLPYRAAAAEVEGFTRTAVDGGPFAARVFDFWHSPPARWLTWPPAAAHRPALYPSVVWLTLSAVGFWGWIRRAPERGSGPRAVVLGLTAAAVLGAILAFGRTMPVPGLAEEVTMPWAWLQDHVWPLQAIRAPSRLWLPATLAIALLGAVPLARLLRARPGVGLVLAIVACLDLAPGRVARVRVQPTGEERVLLDDLRVQPRPTPWALLPMPGVDREESPTDARAMLWAVLAQQPLAGGSTGFVPLPLRDLRTACTQGDCRAALETLGVRRVWVDTGVVPAWEDAPVLTSGRWRVYALNPPPGEN